MKIILKRQTKRPDKNVCVCVCVNLQTRSMGPEESNLEGKLFDQVWIVGNGGHLRGELPVL